MNVAVWPASFWVTWITVLLCVVAAMMVGAMIVEWWQYTADKKAAKAYLQRVCIVLFLVIVVLALLCRVWDFAHAHDHEHPEEDAWYRTLMQPDSPTVSCCGIADAYWCDDYYARDGKAYCRVTDDRDDAPLGRPHVEIGTEIEIPERKLKWEQNGTPTGNPTGHSIVFMSSGGAVFCFVQNGGV